MSQWTIGKKFPFYFQRIFDLILSYIFLYYNICSYDNYKYLDEYFYYSIYLSIGLIKSF